MTETPRYDEAKNQCNICKYGLAFKTVVGAVDEIVQPNTGERTRMANRFQKLLYFLSAESPILIIFAIVWLIEKSTWSKPVSINWKVPVLLVIVSVLLVIIFNRSFNYGKENLQKIHVTATDISGGDAWIVAFIITYLFPLAEFQFGELIKPIVGIVIVLLLITMTFTDFMTPHPILYLRGYHFYSLDVEGAHNDYHLVSKKRLKRASDVKEVSQIFEFLLLRQG